MVPTDDDASHVHRQEGPAIGPAAGFRMAAAAGDRLHVNVIAPPLVAWGLQRLVQTASARLALDGAIDRLADALPLLERQPPDVLILDYDDGYRIADVAELYRRTRVNILVLTSVDDVEVLDRLLAAGAGGVLQKHETPSALLRAIEATGRRELFASPEDKGRLFMAAAREVARSERSGAGDSSRIASLTSREQQTFTAVTSDASAPVKVIADRLCISEHTLRNHLTSIYSKLGVPGRLGLHAYASRHAPHHQGGAALRPD
jgi:two-component system, NarL family, nitrate/nitrite response regulator NarL